MLNNLLPTVLSSLSADIGVAEARLQEEKRKRVEMVQSGVEVNDHWLKQASRVVRVTNFFRNECTRWQLGVLVLVSSEIARLHWLLLGSVKENRRKASLTDLVDS